MPKLPHPGNAQTHGRWSEVQACCAQGQVRSSRCSACLARRNRALLQGAQAARVHAHNTGGQQLNHFLHKICSVTKLLSCVWITDLRWILHLRTNINLINASRSPRWRGLLEMYPQSRPSWRGGQRSHSTNEDWRNDAHYAYINTWKCFVTHSTNDHF